MTEEAEKDKDQREYGLEDGENEEEPLSIL